MFGGGSGSSNLFGASSGAGKPQEPKAAFDFGAPAATAAGSGSGTSAFGGFGVAGSSTSKPTFGLGAAAAGNGTSGFGSSGFGALGASTGVSKPEAFKPAHSFGSAATGSTLGGAGTSVFGGFGAPAVSSSTSGPNTTAFPAFGASKEAAVPAVASQAGTTTGSGLFGSKPADATTASSGAMSFGGFKAPAGTAAAATNASSTLFGGASSTAATTGGIGLGDAKAPSSGLFGAKRSSDDTQGDAPAVANPTAGTGLGGFKLSTAPASGADKGKSFGPTAVSAFGATSTAGAAAKPADKTDNSTDIANAALRGKTLEEIAQMWTAELAAQTRAFHTQANTVGYWDRALVQQGKRITELYEATMGVESEQAALDQNLEHMEGQQGALQNLLDAYEGRVQDIVRKTTVRPAGGKGVAMTADQERDHVYSSAERLNQQLDELARRLTALVEDVNGVSAATAPAGDGDGQRGAADPFAQIVQILNAHLTSLEWVDSQTTQLQERLKTAQRVFQDVASAQSALSGAYGAADAADLSAPSDIPLTIPGAFVSDPPPPVLSSFGTPLGTARRAPGASLLGRTSAGAGVSSPFAGTPLRRGL
ncbi:FG-nucleoporin nsp1 [Coemansia biformis]|uniref:FG-nucleoporin nsp1 n=1 Tax=Coemansia biformis TaxID=1286918 RepID=A0A9W8D098_9FUNG|nr:FG-nucleoporin nsp1 [Coemansia biformis]